MSNSENRRHVQRLKAIIDRNPFTLEAEVAGILLDQRQDDIVSLLRDLARSGCISGMISAMVYYVNTHDFFDRHYETIEALREDTQDNLGEPMIIQGDLKNALAWFAFEETAFAIARDELNLDL